MESTEKFTSGVLRFPTEFVVWITFNKSAVSIVHQVAKVIDKMGHTEDYNGKHNQYIFKPLPFLHHFFQDVSI
jgi:hypothetical protein